MARPRLDLKNPGHLAPGARPTPHDQRVRIWRLPSQDFGLLARCCRSELLRGVALRAMPPEKMAPLGGASFAPDAGGLRAQFPEQPCRALPPGAPRDELALGPPTNANAELGVSQAGVPNCGCELHHCVYQLALPLEKVAPSCGQPEHCALEAFWGQRVAGLLRELNPGPLAPGARIIPLGQAARWCHFFPDPSTP